MKENTSNNNCENFIKEYNIQKVIMDVFSSDENDIKYTLIVADDLVIIDYKIEFRKISIKEETTASHFENNKKNSTIFKYRETFLRLLNLKNKKSQKNEFKKPHKITNHKYLDKINSWLSNNNNFSKNVTFQYIEYMLRGSNSSGQGKSGNGYLKTKIKFLDNKNIPFGLFLKSINISNKFWDEIENNYSNHEILKLKDACFNLSDEISFNDWVKSNEKIYQWFYDFYSDSTNWKETRKKINNYLVDEIDFFYETSSIVSKKRNEYIESIKNKYKGKTNKEIYQKYFANFSSNEDYEKAHIKPVWKIKEEYNKCKNHEILNQISDYKNFLPLPPSIHRAFDKKYFYWKKDGNMVVLNDNHLPKEIDLFKKINNDILPNIKKYLEWE